MTGPPAGLGNALGFQVTRLSTLFRRRLTRLLRSHDPNREQWQVLAALVEGNRAQSQAELARLTLKDRHSVSRMFAKMEANGWVVRRQDPSDPRAYQVLPSSRARRQFAAVAQVPRDSFSPLFEQLPRARRESTLRTVRRLNQIFAPED
jgi:MarR family transcriptional regulator for hemolysin